MAAWHFPVLLAGRCGHMTKFLPVKVGRSMHAAAGARPPGHGCASSPLPLPSHWLGPVVTQLQACRWEAYSRGRSNRIRENCVPEWPFGVQLPHWPRQLTSERLTPPRAVRWQRIKFFVLEATAWLNPFATAGLAFTLTNTTMQLPLCILRIALQMTGEPSFQKTALTAQVGDNQTMKFLPVATIPRFPHPG